jgi:hypothetical protein
MMQRIIGLIFIITTIIGCNDEVNLSPPDNNQGNDNQLSNQEIVKGLKEALKVSTDDATNVLATVDGYYKDPKVRIPYPPKAKNIVNTLNDAGLGGVVDSFEKKLNRAAEDAADTAKPIFVDAIKNMNFQDARNILEGSDTAATHYFRSNTYSPLFGAFEPPIKNSLDNVGATQAWETVITTYNTIRPLNDPVNPDLPAYTTNQALQGLFLKVKKEEKQIRLDPKARVKDILEKVFGKQD